MKKKFNPLWIPFLTFWIPSQIAKIPMSNQSVKTAIIWAIIIVQVYFLYRGINYIKYNSRAGGNNAGSKEEKDTRGVKK